MPDMTMIEKVARAICDVTHTVPWESTGPLTRESLMDAARAAIEAMRELDDGAITVACDASDLFRLDYVRAHQAMIDAALKETP